MSDLSYIEGKTISSLERNYKGKNSFIIIKFKEGGKLNILSFPSNKQGSGQFDVSTKGVKINDLIGKTIRSIIEEYDGEIDTLRIILKEGGEINITPFNSIEDSTANLKTTVYMEPKTIEESFNLVYESIEKYLK